MRKYAPLWQGSWRRAKGLHERPHFRNARVRWHGRGARDIRGVGPMSTAPLLDRLEGVRSTGPRGWVARCPAHEDKAPSLSVRELPDGRVLVHDFAGCDVHDILAAVGLSLRDLFPERLGDNYKREREPFPARDVLKALGHETLVVLVAASTVAQGGALDSDNLDRLTLAVRRIREALDLAGVRHAV